MKKCSIFNHFCSRSLRGNVDRNTKTEVKTEPHRVVPYVGTWIEINGSMTSVSTRSSRSLRGNVDRNNLNRPFIFACFHVVPYVGTWIEIALLKVVKNHVRVVPYVGTWIEITKSFTEHGLIIGSFPTWERG